MWKTVVVSAIGGIAVLSFVYYAVNHPDEFKILQGTANEGSKPQIQEGKV
jgi:hypothetical protein